jgi:SAM-dependent methyltransferase
MLAKKYLDIVAYYERCLSSFGDNHLGVDWASVEGAATRYRVMLDLIRSPPERPVSLLDFGCGASHLLDYMARQQIRGIDYAGLDLSPAFIALSRQKHPGVAYYCVDLLECSSALPHFDYVVMNGVFTQKRDLTVDEMFDYLAALVERAFIIARRGVAFNVMSAHLGWERPDLFHLPFDRLAHLLAGFGGNFVLRNDYGLPEYTVYLYHLPELDSLLS